MIKFCVTPRNQSTGKKKRRSKRVQRLPTTRTRPMNIDEVFGMSSFMRRAAAESLPLLDGCPSVVGCRMKCPPMSALGHKRTYAVHKPMSALPPIATSIAFFGMSALGQ
jgi:hypothetical protein